MKLLDTTRLKLNPFYANNDGTAAVKIDVTSTFAFHHNKEDGKRFTESYKLGPKLESFSRTYRCTHRASRMERSVKVLPIGKVDRAVLLRELDIMKAADHPNLPRFFESFEDDKNIFVVTESLAHENLFDAVAARRKNKEAFGEAHVALILLTLLETLHYCHQRNIVHGDVNPKTILIPKGKSFGQLLLVDYQSLRRRAPAAKDSVDESSGEFKKAKKSPFAAPELAKDNNAPPVSGSDIWSCGVLAHQLLTGKLPFKNSAAMKKKLDSEAFLAIKDPKAQALIQELLTYSVHKRPRAMDAMDYQWLAKGKEVDTEVDSKLQDTIMASLSRASQKNKLQQAVSAYIATNLLHSCDRDELGRIFRECDRNMDGVLSKSELRNCLDKAGIQKLTPNDLDDIFLRMDLDGSGVIGYSEFLANQDDVLCEKSKLRAAFDAFDLDLNGYITHGELLELFNNNTTSTDDDEESNITTHQAKAMISKADQDNDGKISFDEFLHMMSP